VLASVIREVVNEVEHAEMHREPGLGEGLDIVLDPEPLSVTTARHTVGRLLLGAHPPPPLAVVEDVLLLVSELVTNAVLHAGTRVHVQATVEPGRIVVVVSDGDPAHTPHRPDRGALAASGRGMRLVELLASSWGFDLRARSKAVWFEAVYPVTSLALRARPS